MSEQIPKVSNLDLVDNISQLTNQIEEINELWSKEKNDIEYLNFKHKLINLISNSNKSTEEILNEEINNLENRSEIVTNNEILFHLNKLIQEFKINSIKNEKNMLINGKLSSNTNINPQYCQQIVNFNIAKDLISIICIIINKLFKLTSNIAIQNNYLINQINYFLEKNQTINERNVPTGKIVNNKNSLDNEFKNNYLKNCELINKIVKKNSLDISKIVKNNDEFKKSINYNYKLICKNKVLISNNSDKITKLNEAFNKMNENFNILEIIVKNYNQYLKKDIDISTIKDDINYLKTQWQGFSRKKE